MNTPYYIADAFTDRLFSGNQAGVCLPEQEIEDSLMQKIAVENNFSETAFAIKSGDKYGLRWFTPGGEIDLCGHATLATAFIIMTEVDPQLDRVTFATKSGELTVTRHDDLYTMNFPTADYKRVDVSPDMSAAIGVMPSEAYLGRDLLMVLDSEDDVRRLNPDMEKLKRLPGLLQAVTAKGSRYDCVSRAFAPKLDVTEDPVTGSTHCMIAPYWASRLGKDTITAYQASKRGGEMLCRILPGKRIDLSGKCVLYAKGSISI